MDFDSDPKEFTTKAVKKDKYSPLGITIADGEAVNVRKLEAICHGYPSYTSYYRSKSKILAISCICIEVY